MSATARIAELERQLESAKTIAATEAEDAAEMEDRLADARSPDSDALAEASARIATLEADAAEAAAAAAKASECIARLEADARAAKEAASSPPALSDEQRRERARRKRLAAPKTESSLSFLGFGDPDAETLEQAQARADKAEEELSLIHI